MRPKTHIYLAGVYDDQSAVDGIFKKDAHANLILLGDREVARAPVLGLARCIAEHLNIISSLFPVPDLGYSSSGILP